MFFYKFLELCDKKGVSVYKACTEMGLNRSAVAKWKNGAIPNGTTISTMAGYFSTSADYLLDADQKEKPTTQVGGEPNNDNDPVYQNLKRMIAEAKTKKTAFVIGYGGDGEVMPVDEEEYQNLKAYLEVRRAKKKQDK